MASALAVAQSIDDITVCPICADNYCNPKCLPCLHTFCQHCLEQYAIDKRPGNTAICPVCQLMFVIPFGGISTLQGNFYINQLKDIRDRSLEIVATQATLAEENRSRIQLDIDQVREKYELCKKQENILEEELAKFLDSIAENERLISTMCEDMIHVVQSGTKDLLHELCGMRSKVMTDVKANRNEIKGQLAMCESFLKYSQDLKDKAPTLDVISVFVDDLHTTAKDLLDMEIINATPTPNFQFHPSDMENQFTVDKRNVIGAIVEQNVETETSTSDNGDSRCQMQLSSQVLVHSTTIAQPVRGVAVLSDEVFIIRHGTRQIEIFDTKTFTLQRRLAVILITDPRDMISSTKLSCLYISDREDSSVLRLKLDRSHHKWSVYDAPEGLSIPLGKESNVLVTCPEARKIKEYTSDGYRIREIILDISLVFPVHALNIWNDEFLVCHGGHLDPLHRVCIVDKYGRSDASYGGSPGSEWGQMHLPLRIAFTGSGRNVKILVLDHNNHRVLQMDWIQLNNVKELIPADQMMDWYPVRLCLDSKSEHLYLAVNEWKHGVWINGQVKVYKLNI